MLKEVVSQLKKTVILLILLMPITGLLYPLMVTALAQLMFPYQANGSLIKENDKLVGSLLIGQSFSSPAYFWGRPSATSPFPYNGQSSSGSNSGPSNPVFLSTVNERVNQLKTLDVQNKNPIPVDLVTASGSGLDPEISPYAALYQVARIAKVRNIPEKEVIALIKNQINPRSMGFLGEPSINVLLLNLALDKLRINNAKPTSRS